MVGQKDTINEDELYLIFATEVGSTTRGKKEYELTFSSTPNQIDFEELSWYDVCKGNVSPPDEYDIEYVIRLSIDYKLIPLHDSLTFSYVDGYYQIIALLYEDLDVYNENCEKSDERYEQENLKRLVFHYGDTLKEVKEKISVRNIKYIYVD